MTPETAPKHGAAIIGPIGGADGVTGIRIECFCGWTETGPVGATLVNFDSHLVEEAQK
jgi:hypothetical protein